MTARATDDPDLVHHLPGRNAFALAMGAKRRKREGMEFEKEQNSTKPIEQKTAKWVPPRGIRFLPLDPKCTGRPFGLQWRVEGKRATKNFKTETARLDFAKSLAGDVKRNGVSAFRLDEDEARTWRAFRAQLGEGATLDDVLTCWLRHGKPGSSLTVREAVDQYIAAKTAEGMSKNAVSHYKSALRHLTAAMGTVSASAVKREEMAEWLKSLTVRPSTRRTHFKRAVGLFEWLVNNRLIQVSPCDGIKGPTVIAEEINVLTVDQGRALFEKNMDQPPELLGRIALEAFSGLRFSSAAQVAPDDILWESRGVNLPAAKIKTRRRQFVDGLPANVWAWLGRSFFPGPWTMTPRQYLTAKSAAMIRAGVSVHNGLRHSFATYHVAAHKDVSRTAVILCHSSPKMLFQHYKGRAIEADGRAWFEIAPTKL